MRRPTGRERLGHCADLFANNAVGDFVHPRSAIYLRIAQTEQSDLTPFAKDLDRKGFGLLRLIHERTNFVIAKPARQIADLLVLD